MKEAITNLCRKQWSKLPPDWDSVSQHTCKIGCSPNIMHLWEGEINALECRKGNMRNIILGELMSQESGDVKAGKIGFSRNSIKQKELDPLMMLQSRFQGKNMKEVER